MKKLILILIILMFAMTSAVLATDPDIAIMKPIGEPSESGYQQYGIFDTQGKEITPAKREQQFSFFSTRLPESYDSRDYGYISPVKNQGQLGTCWAHAFAACAEANMIKKGYEEYFNNYSEAHLAYFFHKRNEAQGDGIDVFDPEYGYFGGGNGEYAACFAENFQALTVESDFPYSMANNSADFSIDEKYRDHADVHMTNFGKLTSADDAKMAIMEYGAISVSYCDLNGYYSPDAAYYQNIYTGINHEVAVVGWDDNFPVEKFNTNCRPQNPGAWLVKNSWGKSFGDFGYFWLSYEEPSLVLGCYYDFEPITDENIVHTHNGGMADILWEVISANIFPIKEDQTLLSVGFDARTYNIVPEKYEIMIYVSDSKPSTPMSGTAKITLKGRIPCDGFHKVTLNTPLNLKAGQYLSVIVIQSDSNNNVSSSMFESGDNYTSEKGESYCYYKNNWYDTHNLSVGQFTLKNTTIKAYCKSNTATVHFNTREAEYFDTQTVNIGECVTRPEDPIKEGYEFLGWYTNNSVTEEWDFSTPVTHDMRLFAKWSEPENIDMKVQSRYFSTSYNPGITLSGDNIKEYTFWFTKNQKYYTYTATFDSSFLNQWRYWDISLGDYEVYADVYGINGEEIPSDIETFTVTDQTALSVHEGFINIVNIPTHGADLYVAQYDNEGRFLGVNKGSHYRSQNGSTIISSKVINAPTTYQNPRFFLWEAGKTTPLCEDE